MPVNLDSHTRAVIKVKVRIDAVGRVFFGGKVNEKGELEGAEELPTHLIGAERKTVLPGKKFPISLADLIEYGAVRIGPYRRPGQHSNGGTKRWADVQAERAEKKIPPNVYIANQRTIDKAVEKGLAPVAPRYIGRRAKQMTEVYDTVDEVVAAMNQGLWKTEFSRGRHAKRK